MLFLFTALFLYRHTLHAHFLDDSLAGFYHYKQHGLAGFLTSFNFPALYYGHDFVYLGYYLLFGLNPVAWHLFVLGLFALNALLIFVISNEWLRHSSISNHKAAALLAAIFFLFSPYQTETTVWIAAVHYQVGMLCLLTGIIVAAKRSAMLLLHVLFVFSLLTIEMTLVFPAIWVMAYVVSGKSFFDAVRKIILPQAVVIVLYFLFTWLSKESPVPHYGTEHLQGWSVNIAGTLLKYFVKFFGCAHFFDYPMREKIYAWCEAPMHYVPIWAGLLLALALVAKTSYRREAKTTAQLLFAIVIMLLPVLNLYFMVLNRIEQDRYLFFASPFMCLLLSFLITRFSFFIYIPSAIGILLLMKKLLGIYTWCWINAAEVQERTLDSYRWFDKSKVYVLNLPQNFDGAYIFRREWRFGGAMLVLKDKDVLNQVKAVAGQNMSALTDGVNVERIDSTTFRVSKIGGNWFWNGSMGAADYETEDYSFKLQPETYTVQFKHSPGKNDAVIFHRAGYWEEVK